MADEQPTEDPKDETEFAPGEDCELTDETLDTVSGGPSGHPWLQIPLV
jgi:hypothetical protein